MSQAYIVLDLGTFDGVFCTAVVGPFDSWREATSAAGDLEADLPGSVHYVHRNAHGLISQLPIQDQLARARIKIAEARARLQDDAV